MTAAESHHPLDTEPPSDVPALPGRARQRAMIQHELIRVRRQAEAARLEAQASRLDAAAEQLECLLKQIDAGDRISPAQFADLGLNATDLLSDHIVSSHKPPAALEEPDVETSAPKAISPDTSSVETDTNEPSVRFDSWEAIRAAQSNAAKQLRHDAAHPSVKPPRMARRTSPASDEDAPDADSDKCKQLAETPNDADKPNPVSASAQLPDAPILLDNENKKPVPRRRKSAAFITSAVVHLILLIVLAGFTLTTVVPKDQVALSASTTEASDNAIQTFQIETAQPVVDPAEMTPDETQYDLDPFGEMAVVEVSPGAVAATSVPPPITETFNRPTPAANFAPQALPSDSNSKMQFCGVEGGGNHFVYLVDSSGSMGDGFISARRALLESIDMLTDEQRFYVIFFDAQCDYMRITRADQNESRSVRASRENKQRLKSWAMRVEMDRGKAPYEPLKYALEKLKPDVIFLLSDGEFPQGIEDLLLKVNRVSNLFGETKPISIIHTISYHSREGESRMRRIAENNFGQYRHVPKP